MGVGLSRVVVFVYGLGLFQSYKSYCMHSHVICIRVDTAAEGAMYEVIAGPQEQRGHVQQENCEHPAQGPVEPRVEQQPEGKPRCITLILNYATHTHTYIYIYIYPLVVHYVYNS